MIINDNLKLSESYQWTDTEIDSITNIKLNAVQNCISYIRAKQTGKKYVPIFFNSQPFVSFAIRLSKIDNLYYEQIVIDNLLASFLPQFAEEEREGFYLFSFNQQIIDILNLHFPDVYSLSMPLYRNPISEELDSHFKGRFYGKYVKDYFGHSTLIVRNEGLEKCFIHESSAGRVTQPFYLIKNKKFISEFKIGGRLQTIDEWFGQQNTSFAYVWDLIKQRAEEVVQRNIRI